jgi:hypothetical protein
LYILDRFDKLMLKMIFKKWKNIIDMYFGMKNYLKSTRNHTVKHALYQWTKTTWSSSLLLPSPLFQPRNKKEWPSLSGLLLQIHGGGCCFLKEERNSLKLTFSFPSQSISSAYIHRNRQEDGLRILTQQKLNYNAVI